MRKTKPVPEFDAMTEEQLDLVHSWFEKKFTYRKVIELMAKPVADGGLNTPITYYKVQKYWHHWTEANQLSEHSDLALTVKNLCDLYNAEPIPYDTAGVNLLMKNAFKLALNPDNKPSDLKDLLRVLSYPTQVKFTERRVTVSEQTLALRSNLNHTRNHNPNPNPGRGATP